eukprot:CAMPEP_0115511242 /NCGR_PEP_ID=MMETSP0271-20121206/73861_1 /TAXON_ID=71861 /ORGANISM="Scrippsiella trochoidea, Strain CCMP3099" /LENGTH=31 /DNA_ID= /DNA_START= /DNA_END= /DNA_ORIENTATION=
MACCAAALEGGDSSALHAEEAWGGDQVNASN